MANTINHFDTLPILRSRIKTFPKDHSGTPNLGGLFMRKVAKSDAQNVYCIPAYKVANGQVVMPFRHVDFAASYYKNINPVIYKRFEILSKFSRIRNHRLMRKINQEIAKHPDKKQFTITQEMVDLDNQIHDLCADAMVMCVNPQYYLDTDGDDDDVEQSTNSWCLNQNAERGKASDNIVIITDLDNIDWFVLIQRQNGPGRSQAAWAGGFVEDNETFPEAALREGEEEVDLSFSKKHDIKFTKTITNLPVIISDDWDVRAKFVAGMENGACVTHYKFYYFDKE
jgi:hypothetical protein